MTARCAIAFTVDPAPRVAVRNRRSSLCIGSAGDGVERCTRHEERCGVAPPATAAIAAEVLSSERGGTHRGGVRSRPGRVPFSHLMNNVQQDVRVAIVGSGVRRAGDGHSPARGRHRGLRRAREGRRRRRHVARQQLSRLRLRRALAPVLVLLRPEPRVDEHLLRAARDLGLPARLRAALRGDGAHPLRPRAARRELGRGRPALASGDLTRRAHRAGARAGDGTAERAVDPRPAGARTLRGDDVPLGHLGPRARPRRRARGRDRHRRLGDPVRPADPAARRAPAPLPAHRAVDHAAPRPPAEGLGAPALPRAAGGPAARARGHLLGARELRARLPPPARHALGPAPRAAPPAPPGPRSRAAPQAHADLPHGLQARPHLQRLPAGARAQERRGRHRRASARCASARS